MSKAKHTHGKLVISEFCQLGNYTTDGEIVIYDAESQPVFLVQCLTKFRRGTGHKARCETRDANATRLVDCWNACEGYANPSIVSELLDMCEQLLAARTGDGLLDPASELFAKATAVIAKAKGIAE